jgi:anti-sigma regulatory factor (Ser/Thr protein kinase)
MNTEQSHEITVSFPSTIDYVPILREFVADALKEYGFTDKFSYRMEIMVDELVGNAIEHGSPSHKSRVGISIEILADCVALVVRDEGGSPESISNLQNALVQSTVKDNEGNPKRYNLGLEIVKMLAESVEVISEGDTVTKVRVLRKGADERVEDN